MDCECREVFMLYGAYVKDWFDNHTEGDGYPVCFAEFCMNEYLDEEYTAYLYREVIHGGDAE